jgi:dCMP deaminase
MALNDRVFLEDAADEARKSKDPSTKVGCVIIRPDRTQASGGFNGFPRGVADTPERYADRPTKYALVVHAEANAIITAHEPLHGYTLYCTLAPCNECAKLIVQAGIKRVVAPLLSTDVGLVPEGFVDTADTAWRAANKRWKEAHKWSRIIFDEAGVELVFI